MKEYSYSILSIFTQQSVNGLTNVVKYVDWRYQVKEEEAVGEKYYRTEVLPPNEVSFTNYNDLTSDIVWGWITSIVDIEQIKLEVDELFENIKNPNNIVERPIPWVVEEGSQYDPKNDTYVLVKDDVVRFGPTFYEHFRFNEQLDILGCAQTMVDDFIARRQGILPTTQPLIIDSDTNVKMYKAVLMNSKSVQNEPLYYQNDFLEWDFSTGVAVGTYTSKLKSIDDIREAFVGWYGINKLDFLERRQWKVSDGNGGFIELPLSSIENDCVNILFRMKAYDNVDQTQLFPVGSINSPFIINITYAQVCDFVKQYNEIKLLTDNYLAQKINEVYSCNTIDEFKLLTCNYWSLEGN